MSDFLPPTGPPPPKVPEGWKAQWNEQYSEWFYVNIYTKKSQWEKPTEPVYPPHADDLAPPGPPPGYTPSESSTGAGRSHSPLPTDKKHNPYESHPQPNIESDEELARRLQAEEDARAGQGNRNAQQDYLNTPMPGYQQDGHSPYPQQQGYGAPSPQPNYAQQSSSPYSNELPPRDANKKGGFLGKLLSKASGAGGSHHSSFRPPGSYGGHAGYPQQQYGYGQPAYGSPMMGGGYGRPVYAGGKRPGGGMGAAGGAALGLGGGLIGGAMLANALDDDDDYREGYQDAMQDQDDFGGGDFGGGDDFGGD